MERDTRETLFRRLKWIFSKSGIITLAIEHFLAMVPATVLVPIMVNNSIGANVIDMSLVLFASGLGTIIFSMCFRTYSSIEERREKSTDKKSRMPTYLGSSFAYIGLTIYLLQMQVGEGVQPGMAYVYVGWSYMFSGLLLILLSFLYKIKFIESFFSKCLPAAVIGPAISLIGLELADSAIIDSGVDIVSGTTDLKAIAVAFATLAVIIMLSLIRRKFLKNTAIIAGMFIGWLFHLALNGVPSFNLQEMEWFTMPDFHFPLFVLPPNWQRLLISVIPATFIVFTENIGRATVINRMQQEENVDARLFNAKSVKILKRSLFSHGMASFAATFIGSVPNTLYAENIAVMGIHKSEEIRHEDDTFIRNITNPYSNVPFLIAAGIAIVCSFSAILQKLLINIPKPVIGGMELFLFGIISAPGIQLLVDQRVNYKKVSNQIITAAVLITGISEISINIQWFELKGMSLALVVGFVLNLFVLALKEMGLLCDVMSMDEVLSTCLSALPKNKKICVGGYKSFSTGGEVSAEDLKKALDGYEGTVDVGESKEQAEFLRDAVVHSTELFIKTDKPIINIKKTANRISIEIHKDILPPKTVNIYINDYQDAIDIEKEYDKADAKSQTEILKIDLSRNIPLGKVKRLIEKVEWDKIAQNI